MFKEKRPPETTEPPEPTATPNTTTERPDLVSMLAELLTQPVPSGRRSTPRRAPRSGYEYILARSALLVALLLAVGIWWVGARFTLDWLRSIGVAVETLGVLAWGFPLGITALEMGMLVARSRLVWAWLFWGGVLLFDIYTTAAGLLLMVDGMPVLGVTISQHDVSSWVAAVAIGVLIAVVPEPAARSIWRELWQ